MLDKHSTLKQQHNNLSRTNLKFTVDENQELQILRETQIFMTTY